MSRQKKRNSSSEPVKQDVFYEDDEINGSGKMPDQEESNCNEGETVSIYEASQQLRTSELAIKTWVDHGHLTSVNGRIPVRSIRECRFNTRRFV
jgi:purine-nucleoside phosphorylase